MFPVSIEKHFGDVGILNKNYYYYYHYYLYIMSLPKDRSTRSHFVQNTIVPYYIKDSLLTACRCMHARECYY